MRCRAGSCAITHGSRDIATSPQANTPLTGLMLANRYNAFALQGDATQLQARQPLRIGLKHAVEE
tara:strand:- start:127 stop:321 length:195 start_codon:yes stop_codon:yes gene_type:complete